MTDPSSSTPVSANEDAELAPGTILDRYEVTCKLGAGGMGVVYRANDPDLDRVVAIKVLHDGPDGSRPSELLQQRLLREAKAMAKLSHPNLVTVYDVGSINKHVFIAMELVEGKTLRNWMAQPTHSWAERLDVMVDAAKGLAAAHAAGVVHRDFKPDNVLIGRHVQVVDFGLARSVADSGEMPAGGSLPAHAPAALTHTGALIGTPAYMSPEQHRGELTDERSDQFSFAVTAYHALFGYRPFRGDTVGEISSAVLAGDMREPPNTSQVPPAVFSVLRRALSTDPSERYPSMLTLIAALEHAAAPPQPRQRHWLFPGIVTAAAAAIVVGVIATDPAAPPPRTVDEELTNEVALPAPPRQLTFRGDVTKVELSPDGRYMAYVSNDRLIVRHVPTSNETTAHQAPNFLDLDWSADSKRLLYSAVDTSQGSGTFVYNVADKRERRLMRPAANVCFVSDTEVARTALTIKRIAVQDIASKKVRWVPFAGNYVWLRAVDCSASQQRFLVLTRGKTKDQLWTIRFDGTQRRLVAQAAAIDDVRWSASGNAIYFLRRSAPGDELMRVDIDHASGQGAGKARVVLSDGEGVGRFSTANDGTIAYIRGRRSSNVWRVTRDKDGRTSPATQVTKGTAPKVGIALSPDGTTLAYTTQTPNGVRLAVRSLGSTEHKTIAKLDSLTDGISWSPDGKHIAILLTDDAGVPRLQRVEVASGRLTTMKVPLPSGSEQMAWSPTGDVLYQLPGNRNYNLVDAATQTVTPLLPKTVGWLFRPVFSPSGDQLAMFWNRSPRGVWVIDMKTRKASLAIKGEKGPVGWSKDGTWLYVVSRSTPKRRPVERVHVPTGRVEPWIHVPGRFERLRSLLLLDDGKSFLLNVEEGNSDVWLVKRPTTGGQAPL